MLNNHHPPDKDSTIIRVCTPTTHQTKTAPSSGSVHPPPTRQRQHHHQVCTPTTHQTKTASSSGLYTHHPPDKDSIIIRSVHPPITRQRQHHHQVCTPTTHQTKTPSWSVHPPPTRQRQVRLSRADPSLSYAVPVARILRHHGNKQTNKQTNSGHM